MMIEFFHGWRRKAGVVSLVMALAMMGAWIRSRLLLDVASVVTSDYQDMHELSSSRMGVMYTLTHFDFTGEPRRVRFASRKWDLPPGEDLLSGVPMKWRIDLAGFRFGKDFHPGNGTGIAAYVIPHWFPTGLLTLLSAYLILWKPRKREAEIAVDIEILQ